MKKIKSITGSATSVTIAVFLSRILGLVREQVLAFFFGATNSMDAYVVAYRIPNLLRDLFAEGALSSAFVKVFSSSLEKKGKDYSFKIASTLITNFSIILFFVVIIGIIFSKEIVSLIAPDFAKNPEKFLLTIHLTQIMMPFILIISLSSILAGMLNTFKVFFLPAFSSALFNLVSISIGVAGYYLLIRVGINPIYAMAIGVLCGGLFQLCFQIPLIKNKGFRFKFAPDFGNAEFKEVVKLVLPVIFGLSVVQINILINTYFATSCGKGAISWYSYAFRIMYVPLGLFGVGLSQALLPELSRQIARKDFTLAKEIFAKALVVSLSVSIPSAIGLFCLSHPIIALLFERGRFTPSDTIATSTILKILAVGLPFYGLTKTTVPLFYSLGKTYIPALGSVIAVVTNVAIILLTIKHLGINGVALGTAGSLLFQCVFLLIISFFILKPGGAKFFLKSFLSLFLASGMLILTLKVITHFFHSSAVIVISSILAGGTIYILFCRLFGPPETYMFFERLFAKFSKR
ncbi:MAG: murein biosynthesis integral membrane protein MurJ [Thermodesulfobacteria bacterium]|nr:murein biosynthesis integral membrane protein MurJ [Thermodesulfobacteriota bacterium]